MSEPGSTSDKYTKKSKAVQKMTNNLQHPIQKAHEINTHTF
ncbi:hypothetical protein SAMD00020551_4601 [Mesobacillus selenatarsenatis SF-1]|uniref:Uncharacterized protein n=1 Tax=Mesobacillus selenatarsenatis (strain DSM 18680 / JCM 14380 / FERM P-15431 / SF-1) TaxID=1321606 RepID=A0A0A8XE77_MESS1|nr:hypothetical protein SAMD00020551_4601 [Mesobacillus selenatarsenatis SF-1]